MFYTEWLRVRNCLRVVGIILACFFVLAVGMRIWVAVEMHQYNSWIDREAHKHGAHVSVVRLADGSTQTTIDDRIDDVHIVTVDHGWLGRSVTVTGSGVSADNANVQVGTLGVQSTEHGRHGSEVNINTNLAIPAEVLLFIASWVAVIVGSILAGPLAKENVDHLEVSWTKPIGRERLALGLFGVDAAGMLLTMAMTIVCMLLCTALFQLPRIAVSDRTPAILVLCVLLPLAWYSLLTVCSASLKRGRSAVIGLGWFAALVLPGIALGIARIDAQPFHAIGVGLEYLMLLNPLTYMRIGIIDVSGGLAGASSVGYNFGFLTAGPVVRDIALAVLCAVYTALSLIQWRRLEA
jgi:hypothetical protein